MIIRMEAGGRVMCEKFRVTRMFQSTSGCFLVVRFGIGSLQGMRTCEYKVFWISDTSRAYFFFWLDNVTV